MQSDRRKIRGDIVCPLPDLPVYDHLGTPPGRWIIDHDRRTSHWEGIVSWMTQHGDSRVRWYMGEMISVWNLRTATGDHVETATLSRPYEHTNWQRITGNGSTITGSLELTDDGILFRDNPAGARRPGNGLTEMLSVDGEFRQRLSDKAFADTVCGYLAENTFRRLDGEVRTRFGGRSAEELVFQLCGTEADRSNRDAAAMVAFEEILEDIGWHAMTPEEFETDRFEAAAMLVAAEAREPGSVPDEHRPKVLPLHPLSGAGGADRYARMLALGRSGMVSQSELDRFASLDHPSAPNLADRLRPVG